MCVHYYVKCPGLSAVKQCENPFKKELTYPHHLSPHSELLSLAHVRQCRAVKSPTPGCEPCKGVSNETWAVVTCPHCTQARTDNMKAGPAIRSEGSKTSMGGPSAKSSAEIQSWAQEVAASDPERPNPESLRSIDSDELPSTDANEDEGPAAP